ncbi:hypothetical protein G7Y89_g625 [Cudoniella acicularis]|uniref:Uncharacterized protein n=1 Tax=Cudoniella acicularis TaxID=354080 RepID=A0A8H4RWT7_9HELO|nr:hypothetical protein G7Y89_g625 [Cudoniella acicularis]
MRLDRAHLMFPPMPSSTSPILCLVGLSSATNMLLGAIALEDITRELSNPYFDTSWRKPGRQARKLGNTTSKEVLPTITYACGSEPEKVIELLLIETHHSSTGVRKVYDLSILQKILEEMASKGGLSKLGFSTTQMFKRFSSTPSSPATVIGHNAIRVSLASSVLLASLAGYGIGKVKDAKNALIPRSQAEKPEGNIDPTNVGMTGRIKARFRSADS